MSTSPTSRIAITFDPESGHPVAGEVTDTTAWPSERATHQALRTVAKIYNQGYAGLKLECTSLQNDETLLERNVNLATPEGHLVICVMGLAERGYAFPMKVALALLRNIYESDGLKHPTPRSSIEQINL